MPQVCESHHLLLQFVAGIQGRDNSEGLEQLPAADKDMTLLDVILNGRNFLQGSCQPSHREHLCP